MPKMNGLDVLKNVRARSTVPIIMLTAKERTTSTESSAWKWARTTMSPNPAPRELLARINAILRRAQHSGEQNNAPNSISVSDVVLYPAKRQASVKDMPLELTSTEFNLLEVLMRHAGQVVSKRNPVRRSTRPQAGKIRPQYRRTHLQHPPQVGRCLSDSNRTRLGLPVCQSEATGK